MVSQDRRVIHTPEQVKPFRCTVVVLADYVMQQINELLPPTERMAWYGPSLLRANTKVRLSDIMKREHIPCPTDPACSQKDHTFVLISPNHRDLRSSLSHALRFDAATGEIGWWPEVQKGKLLPMEASARGSTLSVKASDGRVVHQGLPVGASNYFVAAVINAVERGLLQAPEHKLWFAAHRAVCNEGLSYMQNMQSLLKEMQIEKEMRLA